MFILIKTHNYKNFHLICQVLFEKNSHKNVDFNKFEVETSALNAM